jgi:hypothetical protein
MFSPGCYVEIVRIVLKQRRRVREVNQPTLTFNVLDTKSYRKSLRMFLAVLGVFIACWAPFAVQGFVFYKCVLYPKCTAYDAIY